MEYRTPGRSLPMGAPVLGRGTVTQGKTFLPKRPPIALLALALAVALLGPTAAGAAESGLYGSLSAGAVFLTDSDIDDVAEIEFDAGFGVTGAVGYAFDNGFRTEFELSLRRNSIDRLAVGAVSVDADGHARALAAMFNAAYDFDFLAIPLRPYVMGGLGVANIDAEIEVLGVEADDSDTVFAYQAGAGINFDIAPNVTVFGGYRFFGTADPEIEGSDVEYRSHNLEAGLRYYF